MAWGWTLVDIGLVVVVVVLVFAVVAGLALVRRGRMTGTVELPGGTKAHLNAGRDPDPAGTAMIRDSWAGGDATAIGRGGALIDRTVAGGDVTARADEPPDPKA